MSGKARESEHETWGLPLKLTERIGMMFLDAQISQNTEFRSVQDTGRIQTYTNVGILPGILGGVILPRV